MCEFCQNHEQGDTLYEPSDWDGGIGFDYIRDIKYCPLCGRKLDSEDEPTTQTETQNSNLTFEKRTMLDCYNCKYFCTENCRECHYEPKDEPTSSKMEQVDKDINVRSKTENSSEKPNNCETCKHNKLEWYSEVCDGCSKAHSNYEPKDEPQPMTDAEITELAKEIVHKMIDNSVIAEDAYPDLKQRMHEAVERLDEYYPSEDERSDQ